MSSTNVYVVYNLHVDEFVRINKFTELELNDLINYFKSKILKDNASISNYVTEVVQKTVQNCSKYDLEEYLEALFESVVDVYPNLSIDAVCKTINVIETKQEKTAQKSSKPCTLSGVHKVKQKIQDRLIGQQQAVDECVKSIKLISSGLDKFISLFFIGPTGVGKTELARLLAEEYLGSPKKLLKINCGEYSTGHEYAKLIGSPPGYIGHNEKGILSEKAEQSSEWIILFDEIEKAHPKLMNLLLGFLDDGKITDNRGVELDFSNSIICFTSNIGIKGNVGKSMVGFCNTVQTYEASKEEITKEFKDFFSPEFINRLDSIIYFNQLSKDDASKIAKLHLEKLPIKITKELVDYVVENAFSLEYGARNINRFIRNNITVKIADEILENSNYSSFKPIFKNKKLISVSRYSIS